MITKDKKENAFLELMRCGIWGTSPNTSYFTGLTQSDWLDIYKIAGKQTVLGVCLKPVMDLPNDMKPSANLLLQWVGLCRFIEAENKHKIRVWQELDAKLTQAGFTPVVFKGFSFAKWYANPLLRQCSDIDIYIPDKFNELIQQLKDSGISCNHMPQHDTIEYKGVKIEIHPSIIGVPNKPQLTCNIVKSVLADGTVINIPDVNMYSLVLLTHAAKHFCISSIGYRFLCDWAVFLKHNHKQMDCELVLREIRRIGMQRFVAEFTKLAEIHLGLEFEGLELWTQGSNRKYLIRLSDRLFENGDFGARGFKKTILKSTLSTKCHTVKYLLGCRYYWPKFFWRRIPGRLFKAGLISIMRDLHLPFNWLQ